ncbi:MAG: hypothetical protein A2Y54_00480 [Chloroflexi bacterium RBG_16_51_16]|nr:MAG: hypothetical protein A2Y54_00480 [Chloroflexi bacterium RBG_16_51_16]
MNPISQALDFQSDDEQDQDNEITAADFGGGCTSTLVLPPLTVLLVGGFLFFLSINTDLAAINAGFYASYKSTQQPDIVTSSLLFKGSDITNPNSGLISWIFTPEVQAWAPSINRWAQEAGIDPNLAAVIMQIESCGNPRATSRSGAMGLFQVMPFHFTAEENPYDPAVNASRGLGYLSRSLEAAQGDVRAALAGYNGGIGVIGIPDTRWKDQTRRYVTFGFPIYLDALEGETTSPKLEEWYSKFGANLCHEAGEVLGL